MTSRTAGAIEAVLFDLDGTLVITHIDFTRMRAAVAAVATAAGIAAEEIAGLDILGIVGRASEIVCRRDGEAAAAALMARAEEVMVAEEMRGLDGAAAAPFAAEVLRALSAARIGVAVVTRNCRRAADAVLALAKLSCLVVLTREDVTRRKPDPAHLLAALGRLGVAPDAAVMVGDHPMDMEAGRAAGMRTVGVLHPARPPGFFDAAAPDLVVSDLRGVLPYVLGLS